MPSMCRYRMECGRCPETRAMTSLTPACLRSPACQSARRSAVDRIFESSACPLLRISWPNPLGSSLVLQITSGLNCELASMLKLESFPAIDLQQTTEIIPHFGCVHEAVIVIVGTIARQY